MTDTLLDTVLARAIIGLLDTLHSDDLEALVEGAGGRRPLEAAMTDQASKVLARLEKAGITVPPEEYPWIAVAVTSWKSATTGVQQNTGHAADRARRFLRWQDVSPELLVRADGRDESLIPLVALADAVLRALRSGGPGGPPPWLVTAVVVAVAARALGNSEVVEPDRGPLGRVPWILVGVAGKSPAWMRTA